MTPFLLWFALISTGNSPVAAVNIKVSPNLRGSVCDVSRIYSDVVEDPRVAARGLLSGFRTSILVERGDDRIWDFRIFLHARAGKKRMSWRLTADTCERAAHRTALKLVMVSESLHSFIESTRPRLVHATSVAAKPDGEDQSAPEVQESTAEFIPVVPEIEGEPKVLDNEHEVSDPETIIATVEEEAETQEVEVEEVIELGPAPIKLPGLQPRVTRRRPIGFRVRVAGRAGHGLLPQDVFAGGLLQAALVSGRARFELGTSVSDAGRLDMGNAVRPHPYHVGLQLHGCGEFARDSIALDLCLGLEGGRIVVPRTTRQAPWTLHLTMSPSLTWWFSRHVGLTAGITVGPALVRTSFYVGPTPEEAMVTRALPWFLFAGSFGLEFRTPALDGHR